MNGTRTRSMLRATLQVVALVGLLGAIVVAVTLAETGSAWDAMQRHLSVRVDELEQRASTDRPPVLGDAAFGHAWSDYERARSSAQFRRLDDLADAASRAAVVEEHRHTIAMLVDGTQRHRVGRPRSWRVADEDPWALAANQLGQLLLAAAEIERERGDFEAAGRLDLASLRFARDLAASGPLIDQMVGTMLADQALAELAELVLPAGRLDDRTVTEIERFISELDASWPTFAEGFARETTMLAAYLSRQVDSDGMVGALGIGRLALWPYLFSVRGLAVDWWDHSQARIAVLERTGSTPWPATRDALRALPQPARKSPLASLVIRIEEFVAAQLRTRAALRVLRAGLAFRLRGEVVELIDPFAAAPLRAAGAEGEMRFWSVGADGIDDDGDGSLHPDATGRDVAVRVWR